MKNHSKRRHKDPARGSGRSVSDGAGAPALEAGHQYPVLKPVGAARPGAAPAGGYYAPGKTPGREGVRDRDGRARSGPKDGTPDSPGRRHRPKYPETHTRENQAISITILDVLMLIDRTQSRQGFQRFTLSGQPVPGQETQKPLFLTRKKKQLCHFQ